MSQLVKALLTSDTGKRVPRPPMLNRIFSKTEEWEQLDSFAKKYIIRAVIGTEVYVSDHHGAVDQLGLAVDHAKRYIIEAVFGEFRENFNMVRQALYDQDFLEASRLLEEFETKMFTTDES